ncbi:MAG: hypothetical protein RL189_1034 [Pseudomonadota bacterium]|jgi:hypothetical protein
MKRITLSGMTQLLSKRLADLDSSTPSLNADLFLFWQLAWIAHAGGCELSENQQRIINNLLSSCKTESALQEIQLSWMKAYGLPACADERSDFTVSDFFRSSQQLLAVDSTAPTDAEFVFWFLQVTCGLPADQKEPFLKLFAHALAPKGTRALTVVRRTFDTQWIDIADECDKFEKTFVKPDHSACLSLTLLVLPSSLQTPMSWMLRGESPDESSDIFIAWPSGHCSSSIAEQHALLAHELEHCRQLALQTSGVPTLSVYQRELEALKCEWTLLNAACAHLPSGEAKTILEQWKETHTSHQLQIFKEDFAMYRSAVEGEIANAESLPLRLPFASLNYAICAALAAQIHLP